jgi:sugar phosphate isomerase/epimerase
MHVTVSRRQFLCTGATLAAAATLGTRAFGAAASTPLGVQFFSFNRQASEGWPQFSAAMQTVRDIGYDGIQFAGLMGHAPDKIRQRAGELGLKVRSMHIGNDQVRAFRAPDGPFTDAQDAVYTPQGIVQIARVNAPLARDLGCECVMLAASGPANMQSIDTVMRMCDAMNRANEIVRRAGLKLSYHNHQPDFRMIEGRRPFDVMIENTDASLRYELDVAWVAAGGADPVAVIDKYWQRVTSFHLKDVDKAGKAATCGDGTLDFAAIRRAAQRIENPLFYVECEGAAAGDPAREPTRALKYLRSIGW